LRVLLLGSLLVVFGVVAWASMNWAIARAFAPPSRAEPIAPIFRFVSIGPDRDGSGQLNAIVWQTSTALEDCADVIARRNREEKKRIAELLTSDADFPLRHEEPPCTAFQLGEVEDGTKVEVLGECGQMARVRIVSGGLRGREGCIETKDLTAGKWGQSSFSGMGSDSRAIMTK
jgi:hypothetical protein